MLLRCRDNDTSSLIDDESARTSSAHVDSQKIHCRFARFLCAYTIGQVRCMFRIRIVNFKIVYCLRARHDTPKAILQCLHSAPSQERGFPPISGQTAYYPYFPTTLTP